MTRTGTAAARPRDLITDTETTPAPVADAEMTGPIRDALGRRRMPDAGGAGGVRLE